MHQQAGSHSPFSLRDLDTDIGAEKNLELMGLPPPTGERESGASDVGVREGVSDCGSDGVSEFGSEFE